MKIQISGMEGGDLERRGMKRKVWNWKEHSYTFDNSEQELPLDGMITY